MTVLYVAVETSLPRLSYLNQMKVNTYTFISILQTLKITIMRDMSDSLLLIINFSGIKIRYPEFETMIHCRNILVATLTKLDQANNLRAMCYKEGLLTSHQHEALLAFPSGNSRLLVDALANNIRASPHFFYDFMFILVEYVDWSKDLMHTLKKKYEGTKCFYII